LRPRRPSFRRLSAASERPRAGRPARRRSRVVNCMDPIARSSPTPQGTTPGSAGFRRTSLTIAIRNDRSWIESLHSGERGPPALWCSGHLLYCVGGLRAAVNCSAQLTILVELNYWRRSIPTLPSTSSFLIRFFFPLFTIVSSVILCRELAPRNPAGELGSAEIFPVWSGMKSQPTLLRIRHRKTPKTKILY